MRWLSSLLSEMNFYAYIYLISFKFKLKGGKLYILFSCISSRTFDSAERLNPAIALKVRPLHELYLSTPLRGLSLLPFPLHVSVGIFVCGAAVPFARASSVYCHPIARLISTVRRGAAVKSF